MGQELRFGDEAQSGLRGVGQDVFAGDAVFRGRAEAGLPLVPIHVGEPAAWPKEGGQASEIVGSIGEMVIRFGA